MSQLALKLVMNGEVFQCRRAKGLDMRTQWTKHLVATVFVAMSLFTLSAQDAANKAAHSGMMAKDADPDWEAVTVKPSDPNATNGVMTTRGRHMVIQNQTM